MPLVCLFLCQCRTVFILALCSGIDTSICVLSPGCTNLNVHFAFVLAIFLVQNDKFYPDIIFCMWIPCTFLISSTPSQIGFPVFVLCSPFFFQYSPYAFKSYMCGYKSYINQDFEYERKHVIFILLSLGCLVFSSSIQMKGFCLSLQVSKTPLVYTMVLIHLSLARHLWWLHFLDVVSSAARNTGIHVSLVCWLSLLWIYPGVL